MSDTRTIRMALVDTTGRISERLGLDPETVLERMCETCEGRGTIDTSIHERHVVAWIMEDR